MKIRLFKGYAQDRRVSMDIYAERISVGLGNLSGSSQQIKSVNLFQPASPLERFSSSSFVMRYLRYVAYPSWTKKINFKEADDYGINHILDHGYAHLVAPLQKSSGSKALAHSKVCVTVHDLIPILAWKGRLGRKFQGRKPLLALHSASRLRFADKVFAVSRNTADDLMELCDLPAKSIEVVAAPITDDFSRASDSEIQEFRDSFDLSNDYFWILVSGSEFYKNHDVVVRVFNELRKRKLPVKILKTGLGGLPESSPLKQIESDAIHVVSLDSTQLAALYSSVDCVLFPSLYEGFGYPVVEALSCGTPVVCSNVASLPEVGGELARTCAPDDWLKMAKEIESLTKVAKVTTASTSELRTRGPEWTERYRASVVAKQMSEHYLELFA